MSFPLLSLVIPTRHRPLLLRRLLASLCTQSLKSFEVVLVDDSDRDVLGDIASNFPQLQIRYLRNRTHGANRARNLGLQQARGRYISFLDDDVFLTNPNHLHLIVSLLSRSDRPILLGGYYRSIRSSTWAQRIYNSTCNLWLRKGFRLAQPILLGGNLSCRREDLNPEIYFSEPIFRGGDEIAFHERFRRKHPSHHIQLESKLSVCHDSEMTWASLRKNSLSQQKNNPTTFGGFWRWFQKPSFDIWFAFPALVYVCAGKIKGPSKYE